MTDERARLYPSRRLRDPGVGDTKKDYIRGVCFLRLATSQRTDYPQFGANHGSSEGLTHPTSTYYRHTRVRQRIHAGKIARPGRDADHIRRG